MNKPIVKAFTHCAILASVLLSGSARPAAAQDQGAQLQILVIGGEGSINNVKQRTAREPVVEVRDRNNRPVAGAAVLFEAPSNGASGTFVGGSRALRVTTDAQGRAVGRQFQPNTAQGNFTVNVTAEFQGLTATTVIHMQNVAGAAIPNVAKAGVVHAKLIAVVAAVGAAAAAGAAVAITHSGGGGTTPPTPPTPTTITPGAGSVGPHP